MIRFLYLYFVTVVTTSGRNVLGFVPLAPVSLTSLSSLSSLSSLQPQTSKILEKINLEYQHHLTTSATSTTILWAKKAKNKKKSKKGGGGGSAGSSLKGFGGATTITSSSSKSNVEIDKSKQARNFYEYLESGSAGDNLKRCSLGYFPIPIDNNDETFLLRGIVATKELKKGDDIIRIPYELALNLGPEGIDPTVPAITFLKDYCNTMTTTTTTTGGNNNKKAYYEMLPPFRGEDCLGSTDFFSDEALKELQCPYVVEETLNRRELAQVRLEKEVENEQVPKYWIDGETPITVEHLQWAVWIITSRVLIVQGEEGSNESYRLLIPFLDMCNHDKSSTHILTGRAIPGGELKVISGCTVKPGDQINICYGGGMAGNDRFIQDYGFLDTSSLTAYTFVAQQLLGKRKMVEGNNSGRYMLQSDIDATMEQLRTTTIAQDKQLLLETNDPSIRSAIQYRLGVKQELSKFIVMK